MRLLRCAPLPVTAAYLVGTVPFMAGALWFWTDMSYGAYAHERLPTSALLLALLFVWMKVWQSVFGSAILAFAADEPLPRWTPRAVLRTTLVQGALQPLGFIALPLAMIIAIPYPACSAFFQNLLVLDSPQARSAGEVVRDSRKQASFNPAQNLKIIWLLCPWSVGIGMLLFFGVTRFMFSSVLGDMGLINGILWFLIATALLMGVLLVVAPFGAAVLASIAILLVALPTLLNTLFGIHTPFTTVGFQTIFNTTFLAICYALTYLVMHPLFIAAHALRCFESCSRTDGRDIRVSIRRFARAAPILTLLLLPLSHALAEPPPPQPPAAEELNHSIDSVIDGPRFTWRMPRARDAAAREEERSDTSWFARQHRNLRDRMDSEIEKTRAIIRRMERAITNWLDKVFGNDPSISKSQRRAAGVRFFGWSAIIILSTILIIMIIRNMVLGRRVIPEADTGAATAIPDLEDAAVTADMRPSDEWLRLAEELLAQGEYRLALRALFLSILANLGKRGLVGIAPYKANRDYLTDLNRRAHDRPEAIQMFTQASRLVECHWYGDHVTDAGTVEILRTMRSRLYAPMKPELPA